MMLTIPILLGGGNEYGERDLNREMLDPQDVISKAEGTFLSHWEGSQGFPSGALMTSTAADAHSSSWGNFAMRDMSRMPRIEWNNSPSYTYSSSLYSVWDDNYDTIEDGILVQRALDRIPDSEFEEIGENPARIESFVKFATGLAYGYLALFFDQAYLLDRDTDLRAWNDWETAKEPVPYDVVLDRAISSLNESIEIAQNSTFEIGRPLTFTAGVTLTSEQFAELARSYKAHYRAQVARTPTERSNIDWNAVIDDVESGMEASGYSGPFSSPQENVPAGFSPISPSSDTKFDALKWYGTSDPQNDTWSRSDYLTIGAADTSACQGGEQATCYEEWKTQFEEDPEQVNPYVTETPDRRIVGAPEEDFTCGELVENGRAGFPEGVCNGNENQVLRGSADGKHMGFRGTVTQINEDSIAIRPINGPFPVDRGTYHFSDRAPDRYLYYSGSQAGPMPILTKPEMDLIKAEGLLRTGGSLSKVAGLINNTRVENGELPPADPDEVPVGSPDDPPNPLPPGEVTLWSMLKYEFNIETMLSAGGINFFADRGWGDLIEGTPKQFPIPGRSLLLQGLDLYTFGGNGSSSRRQISFDVSSTLAPPKEWPDRPPSSLEPE